ncbi:MAG: succinyldiaminopimelate transaminase [Chromatiales bacterium]|jgi:N-succinyldiaminopimelate aminotransferase|nr:succinyldiaminopimelate transaminase [Chromatiales bacterium]MDX9768303.1 succinyldiaminopimelate transaminase [Ectothiorhodospiraceae bacterium]
MNPDLDRLQPYPFQKLATLKAGITPPADRPHIALSIGEPKHPTPGFIAEALLSHLHGLAHYPLTRGSLELRRAAADWLTRRFGLPAGGLDPERQILPVLGTREALFALAQCVVDRSRAPLVVMPNPFYQIYEGAALLAGAEPYFVNCTADTGFLPDFEDVPDAVWQRCQLLYLCSPGNPTGAVLDEAALTHLIELADRHDFIIAADECYSEIYFDEDAPPPGLLGAAARMGNDAWRRCIVFHSLSKRSNVPGLRSGFVAGNADLLDRFHLYRTYHGASMPPPTQAASAVAWADERHVFENRLLYREKFEAVLRILASVMDVQLPDAGFYLWPRVAGDDQAFARELFARENVTVLPGSYLSREAHGINPGHQRVRMALVAPLDECIEAAERIRRFVTT